MAANKPQQNTSPKIPKLRFAGFGDKPARNASGSVAGGWGEKGLGEVCDAKGD